MRLRFRHAEPSCESYANRGISAFGGSGFVAGESGCRALPVLRTALRRVLPSCRQASSTLGFLVYNIPCLFDTWNPFCCKRVVSGKFFLGFFRLSQRRFNPSL